MVICGATGDLTERKLGPALYNLLLGGFLPPEFTVVGFARREMSDDAFRDHLRKGVDRHSRNRPIKESIWESFAQGIQYHDGSFDDPEAWASLVQPAGPHRSRPGDGRQSALLPRRAPRRSTR